MPKNIYLIGGCKGGVGKSLVTMATIDFLQEQGHSVFLVETDASNPDVWKTYKDEIKSDVIDLDTKNGWVDLVNICESNADNTIVINTAARNNRGVSAYGETLNGSLAELKRTLVTLWVINRQRDSLELLKDYMDSVTNSVIHVLLNEYFGEERKFELYSSSKLRASIENRGGKSIVFPDLADRVTDDIYSNRIAISKAIKELPIGSRAELNRWRNEIKKSFEVIINE
jgi:hypothetical protein